MGYAIPGLHRLALLSYNPYQHWDLSLFVKFRPGDSGVHVGFVG